MAAPVTLGNSIPDLAQSMFKAVDSNGDGQVSADEFSGFLKQFLSTMSKANTTLGLGSAAQAVATSAVATAAVAPIVTAPIAGAASGPFAPIQGFDFTKLQNTSYTSAKYSAAVRSFSQGLAAGIPIARNNLQPMVDYVKANGFPNAAVSGDDAIDFGDGKGPIDVVQVNESIWFNNTH
jgi:hypothetical protein